MCPSDPITSIPKQRIFDAAVKLFARKGYDGVGLREIVKEADVNISMVKYYFGSKGGILLAIMESAYEKYYQAAIQANDETMPAEERTRIYVRNLIRFFDQNTEMALVTVNMLPYWIPEICPLQTKWSALNGTVMGSLYRQLHIDLENPVHISVYAGFLGNIIINHFQRRYAQEHQIYQGCQEAGEKDNDAKQQAPAEFIKYDDAFYDRYTEMLVDQFYYGVRHTIMKDNERNNT